MYGIASNVGMEKSFSVTFPTSFTGKTPRVVITPYQPSAGHPMPVMTAISATKFSARFQRGESKTGGTIAAQWIAFGY